MKTTRILFVCMGNICRSPMAEGVMRDFVEKTGLAAQVEVDSAGTHGYYCGKPPDPRAQAAARRRGYDLSALRARTVEANDFERFDVVLGMDFTNLEVLEAICPHQHRNKLGLLMQYASRSTAAIVHDPYDRGPRDFERVLERIEDACWGLLQAVAPQAAHQWEASRQGAPARMALGRWMGR